MSTAPNQTSLPQTSIDVTETRVNTNVRLYVHNETAERPRSRPRVLVLMLGWLLGKHAVIKKYTNIYLDAGCDVIQIQVQKKHLLRPTTAASMMIDVQQLCQRPDHVDKHIFVHAISAGMYVYGALLNHIVTNDDAYESFGRRLRGQIYDSFVDVYVFPYSVPTAVTSNALLRRILRFFITSYMTLARGTTRMYKKAANEVKTNHLKVPTKVVYAQSDTLCLPEELNTMTQNWVYQGIMAEIESWTKAPHAAILKEYPEEYKRAIKDFLELSVHVSTNKLEVKDNDEYTTTHM